MDTVWEHETILSPDLAAEGRWPTWASRAGAEFGLASMMCLQLFVSEETVGALTLYSMRTGALTQPENRHEAEALAAHISVALVAAQEIEHLHHALLSRTLIGQAEGILMERFDMTAAEAFEVLKRVSAHSQVKLHKVAEEIVRSRQMPPEEW